MAMIHNTNLPRILVAGCGALGGMIARDLSGKHQVFGLRRTPSKVPAPVEAVGADLLDAEGLTRAVPENLDALVYCLTPSSYDEEGYRAAFVTGLQNLLGAIRGTRPKRLIFISSTSVYHQDDDGWVDETSPTRPARASAKQILEGERLALDSGIPATVIRFSGIYGPTRRRFLEAVVKGRMAPSKPAPYTNRIHEEDAARAVVHLLTQSLVGAEIQNCYLASDCAPAGLDEVVEWIRQQTPCAPPAADARTGGRAGSKRCDNHRLRDSGFEFDYPDYRAGYGEMIG
ncbi:NAD-dependent epimerase/dehydratase family protein [Marinobacter sp.]|uniref:NAD-dependent epimerase/dehydratase family protein n=1 Tax=Marinobacter sp. TaxID=50741 RepID=UPI00384C52A4